MSTPAPRPTTARLLRVGDVIKVSPPGGVCWATITALHDDEAGGVIHIDVTTETGEQMSDDAHPSHTFERMAAPDDTRETVMVDASDFWKWSGTYCYDPNTNRRVQIIHTVRGPHPDDNREIYAMVVWDGRERRPIYWETNGKILIEDN